MSDLDNIKIKLLGQNINIEFVESTENEEYMNYYWYLENKIQLIPQLKGKPLHLLHTLLHECLHAWGFWTGIKTFQDDENIVDMATAFMVCFLVENWDLVKKIIEKALEKEE